MKIVVVQLHKKQAREPTTAYPPNPPSIAKDSIAQMFWREVYLTTMRTLPGATHDKCAQRADDACTAHIRRFKD